MARFRAVIRGQRGEASRLGSKSSGIRASVDGWDTGVDITAQVIDGVDVIRLYATGGSNGGKADEYIGSVKDGKFYLSESFIETEQQAEARRNRIRKEIVRGGIFDPDKE